MYLTGFADEAAQDLATQIKATKEIGWTRISARGVNGANLHELPDDEFDKVAGQLDDSGITIPEFGSLIGNWGKKITSDFDITLAEIERAIPRMQRLNTKLIRIMSYAQEPWGNDQQEEERFRRLREIHTRFADAGLQAVHENCMNWGGFSPDHTLRLVEEVPGLKLIFDTANPVFQLDRSKSEPFPWQDPLEFYNKVKEHVVHIHIKDCPDPAWARPNPPNTPFLAKVRHRSSRFSEHSKMMTTTVALPLSHMLQLSSTRPKGKNLIGSSVTIPMLNTDTP